MYEKQTLFDISLNCYIDFLIQSRETALHIAVKSKNLEMVKLLLDHGASCENIDRVSLKQR